MKKEDIPRKFYHESEKQPFPYFGRDEANSCAFFTTQQYDEFDEVYESRNYISEKTLNRLKAELVALHSNTEITIN